MALGNGGVVLDEEPGAFLFGALKNVMVFVWHQQATGDTLARLGRAVEEIKAEYPQGRSSVHVVVGGAAPPTTEARDAFVRLASDAHLACVGVVFLGSGFWSSALRASSTGMTMEANGKFALRHHETIEELASWLPEEHSQRTGVKIGAEALVATIKGFVES